jgi:hypothetical protein
MQESYFLCLAVSRRDGGKCIAGIDFGSRRWVRPVGLNSHGAVNSGQTMVSEGDNRNSWLAALDIVRLPLGNYVGTTIQPENWELLPPMNQKAYEVVRRFDPRQDMELLIGLLQKHGPLLHSYGDSIAAPMIGAAKLDHSLSLIEPYDLYWKVAPKPRHPTQFQVRAEFSFDGDLYSISVTDPAWEARFRGMGEGRHKNTEVADSAKPRTLLVVSLGGVPFNGQHYKFVASVLTLPT